MESRRHQNNTIRIFKLTFIASCSDFSVDVGLCESHDLYVWNSVLINQKFFTKKDFKSTFL